LRRRFAKNTRRPGDCGRRGGEVFIMSSQRGKDCKLKNALVANYSSEVSGPRVGAWSRIPVFVVTWSDHIRGDFAYP